MLAWLAPLFALTALIYASVGFAGGSTYTALLVLAGIAPAAVPLISLACNIVVSTGGVLRFARAGQIPWRRAWPLLVLSVPMAWLGGRMPIGQHLFILLLGGSLLVAGALLLVTGNGGAEEGAQPPSGPGWPALLAAPVLGLLSGLVGIGGGIFLAPLLHLIRWDRAQRVAGTASLFILANSVSGLIGQMVKQTGAAALTEAQGWWGLVLAVLIGGQIGSWLGVRILPPVLIRRVTGVVVILAAIRLLTS